MSLIYGENMVCSFLKSGVLGKIVGNFERQAPKILIQSV